ncbi:MAG: GSCFA domain-containing protein [Rikenellaceae bacterium]
MKEMKLRTEIGSVDLGAKISYDSEVFAIGSCFAERIGSQLRAAKFCAVVNPTGVLFNPASICATLERVASCRFVGLEELHPFDVADSSGGWFHYDFHSSLSCATAEQTLERINDTIAMSHEALKRADTVLVTLGTAWIYELADSGSIVANCHKQPARSFVRRRLSVEEIVSGLERVLSQYLVGKSVVLTLSPIRHVADGLAENSLSKATLRVAIDEVVRRNIADCRIEYFPAYEMLIDDLRDYRFYESDMVHPSPVATQYIYDSFCRATMSDATLQTTERVAQVLRAASHRPQNRAAQQFRDFCTKQLESINKLKSECAKIDFADEIEYFGEQLR